MSKFFSYTLLTVLTLDLLATSGDITMTWNSPISPKLKSNDSDVNPFDRPITDEEESWIGALINIGAMIGPFPYGYIAERYGRKVGLLLVAIPHIISYLTLAFSKTVYLYYFARLLGGIAVGGGYVVLPTYVAEVAEDSDRGMWSVTLNIFWTFGNLLPYAIGPYIPVVWFNVILACIPTTFFICFLLIAPETPHYLIGKNKIEEAKKSLMLLRSNDEKLVEYEIQHIQQGLEKEEESGNFFDLFKSKIYLKGLAISLMLILAQQLSGISAITFNTQEIFQNAGVNGLSAEVSSIILGMVMFMSSFITPFFADRAGRRILLLISLFGMSVTLFAFGIFFFLKEKTNVDVGPISWLPIVSMVFFILSFSPGIGPLPWTVSSELFPTCVKSSAATMVSFTCWTASFFVTKFFDNLIDSLGHGGTFWLFAGCSFVAGILTFLTVPETKGKSFREIQELLKR